MGAIIMMLLIRICAEIMPQNIHLTSNARVELQNCMYNGYEVVGYAGNFVRSNDLFTPPQAA